MSAWCRVNAPLLRRFLWVGITAFGSARWTNLHDAFVRPGLIAEPQSFAISR